MKEYAGVIVRAKNKCLLCKRSPDQEFLPNIWSVPSGHVEDNETPIEGAVREFYEETSLKPSRLKPVSIMYNNDDSRVHLFLMDVSYQIMPDLERAIDGNEHTECGYFNNKQLKNLKTTENLRKVLEVLL
jgi:8-oxo-dGTP pyrophosphatase MutT (NUDIX family)